MTLDLLFLDYHVKRSRSRRVIREKTYDCDSVNFAV